MHLVQSAEFYGSIMLLCQLDQLHLCCMLAARNVQPARKAGIHARLTHVCICKPLLHLLLMVSLCCKLLPPLQCSSCHLKDMQQHSARRWEQLQLPARLKNAKLHYEAYGKLLQEIMLFDG